MTVETKGHSSNLTPASSKMLQRSLSSKVRHTSRAVPIHHQNVRVAVVPGAILWDCGISTARLDGGHGSAAPMPLPVMVGRS